MNAEILVQTAVLRICTYKLTFMEFIGGFAWCIGPGIDAAVGAYIV